MTKLRHTSRFGALAAALLLLGGAAKAQPKPSEAACAGPELACATSVTPAFAPDGALWLVWAAADRIWAAKSTDIASKDLGKTLSPAIAVTPEAAPLDCGPEARPKVVIDAKGQIVVSYTVAREARHHSQAMFSRSTDGGKSFSAPKPITADTVSQRFETLAQDADGRLFAAWIDKRRGDAAKAAGQKYAGSTLAYAWSTDGGASFGETRFAADHICECCRMDSAFAASGKPVVLFRNIFDNGVRDHAIVAFAGPDAPGPALRVSADDWAIDACPHHGPSLTVAAGGSLHAVWFTQGRTRKGVFYARSTDGGHGFSEPTPLGAANRQVSRPYILAGPDALHLIWKEFDGERTTIQEISSRDNGSSWTKSTPVAETTDASDHPLLISDGRGTFLSWLTRAEGFRLLPLKEK